MLQKDNDFHVAILKQNPAERALLAFVDPLSGISTPSLMSVPMVWTGDDISASSGLKIVESVNTTQELAIGQVAASTAQVSIFNNHGLLNDITSQANLSSECHIYLGVKVSSTTLPTYADDALCTGFLGYANGLNLPVTGHSTAPYLRIGGQAVTVPGTILPSYPVHALLIEEGDGYAQIIAIGETPGYYYGVKWQYGSTWGDMSSETWGDASSSTWGTLFGSGVSGSTPGESPFMYLHTFSIIASRNLSYMIDGTTIYESHADGTVDTWDYAPLGIFSFDKPTQRDQYIIPFTAYDRMTHFDADIGSWLENLTYPITLFNLLDALCLECNVPNAMSVSDSAILNATMSIAAKPDLGMHPTGRTLLRYIAEASGTNARINRDGELELVAVNDDPVYLINPNPTYPAYHAVFDTQIASYNVAQIDKLSIDTPQENTDPVTVSVGSGNNAYILTGNPLLQDEDTTVVETRITPIYNRLSALLAYAPSTIRCTCDWSVQAGDCVKLWYMRAGESTYAGVVLIPVFTQTIVFNGTAVVTYESHGNPKRINNDFTLSSGSPQIINQLVQIKNKVAQDETRAQATYLPKTGNAYRSQAIPFGALDGTSTSTAMTATVDGITELRDGVCMFLSNGVVTSAAGVTLNINGLGAKPIYQSNASATAVAKTFNIAYTMLFVYNSSRVSGGCWDMYYGYDSNDNTLAYNIRRGNSDGVMHTKLYRYQIVFTLRNGELEPANAVSNKPSLTTKALTTQAFDPLRPIYYYNTTTAIDVGSSPSASYLYEQHGTVDLRYGFNTSTTLTEKRDVYLKVVPQADETVKLAGDDCVVQALPQTADGYVYLYLGRAYSTSQITLDMNHPMYAIIGGVCKPWRGETPDQP